MMTTVGTVISKYCVIDLSVLRNINNTHLYACLSYVCVLQWFSITHCNFPLALS